MAAPSSWVPVEREVTAGRHGRDKAPAASSGSSVAVNQASHSS